MHLTELVKFGFILKKMFDILKKLIPAVNGIIFPRQSTGNWWNKIKYFSFIYPLYNLGSPSN